MSSFSGRVSSAQMLRFKRRKSSAQTVNEHRRSEVSDDITHRSMETEKKQAETVLADTQQTNQNETFKLLTCEILNSLNAERKIKKTKMDNTECNKKTKKEKLVNGEIVYDNVNEPVNQEIKQILEVGIDQTLEDGNPVPNRLGTIPKQLLHKPLVEFDPYLNLMEETFVIVSKRLKKIYIHRFTSTKAIFLLSPFNTLRQLLMFITTWQYFDWFMLLAILANCVTMAISLDENQSDITEYVFISLYSVEAIIKVCSKGFILNKYTYLRDPWNCLDFLLLIVSYISIILSKIWSNNSVYLSAIKALRAIRAFKAINIIPGLKTIVNTLIRSLTRFSEVMVLMIFMLVIFSIFTLRIFKGCFRRRCVLQFDETIGIAYSDWTNNTNNWFIDINKGEYAMCRNRSISNDGWSCSNQYACLDNIGPNPFDGLYHFDDFGSSMLLNLQLFNLDHFEDPYERVINTMGMWSILFFILVVYVGSYYLINLVLAVIVLAYEKEAENTKRKLEEPPAKKNVTVYDINALREKIAKKAKEIEERKKKQEFGDSMGDVLAPIVKLSTSSNNKSSDARNGIQQFTANGSVEDQQIETINLSSQIGRLAKTTQEDTRTIRFNDGRDLIVDERNYLCCLKFPNFYVKWMILQNKTHYLVNTIYFELFITFCIILNTVIMAIQYYGQPDVIDQLQNISNYVISSIFILESVLKIIAFGRLFFFDASNWFDLFIILLSIIDFLVPQVDGLSVFRAFRLMRIFKLAKTWKTMRKIIQVVFSSFSALGYLSIMLLLIIYIFSVIGMNLFRDKYKQYYGLSSNLPRSNFNDVLHSFLTIFRLLCGEYSESLAECWVAAGPVCCIVYFPTIILGNYMVFNLFLALLLDAFDADSFNNSSIDNANVKDDKNKAKNIFKKMIFLFKNIFCCNNGTVVKANQISVKTVDSVEITGEMDEKEKKKHQLRTELQKSNFKETIAKKKPILMPCFPLYFYKSCGFSSNKDSRLSKKWESFRSICLTVITNKLFETFIMISIFVSSITLAFDDVYLKYDSNTYKILQYVDYTFQCIFIIEMVLKWFGYGLKKYFSDNWCLLDFSVVCINLTDFILTLMGSTNIGFLKVLRSFRAFRPLKSISRLESMKIVVYALANSIPAILNVFVVCLLFWLIFSIMGVTLFKGKFYKCIDAVSRDRLDTVKNKNDCLALGNQSVWYNSKINFDNVLNGYLALFQLATFEGWQEIIADGVDSTGIDQQPSREANPSAYLFFISFIIFGAFFTLNLFVGVIIDNFSNLKRKYEHGIVDVFLTQSQVTYYETMKKLVKSKPLKAVKPPTNKTQRVIFKAIKSKYFELSMCIIILIHTTSIACDYYTKTDELKDTLIILDCFFSCFYGIEVILKLIGLKEDYFRDISNNFDFFITMWSLIGVPLSIYFNNYGTASAVLDVLRMFRVIRIFRLFKLLKGIRKLIIAFLISIPGLVNISGLLFLLMYIYAIIGMNFFMNMQLQASFSQTVNFQTFWKSFLLLFRLSTGNGWDDVLSTLRLSSDDPNSTCNDSYDIQALSSSVDPQTTNGCGNTATSIIFMVSYVFIMRLIMMNMMVAIIFENYSEARKQEEIGVTEDDFAEFYEKWKQYDPEATQFIHISKLSDLVAELEPPLGIQRPNEITVVSFDLPIIKGDRIHCLDILHGLVYYYLHSIDDNDEFYEIQKSIDTYFIRHFPVRIQFEPVMTTIQRKKMEIAARTLQRAWKKYKLQKTLRDHFIPKQKSSTFLKAIRE